MLPLLNTKTKTSETPIANRWLRAPSAFRSTVLLLWVLFSWTQNLSASEVEGFVEPFRTIDLASSEVGVVTKLFVKAGDSIEVGQTIAQLEDEIYQILVEIAQQRVNFRGELKAAEANVRSQRELVRDLTRLEKEGFAQTQELATAKTKCEEAEARLLSQQEELLLRRLQLRQAEIELEHRTVKSPVKGVVVELMRDPGEYLSGQNPVVLSLVQVHTLYASFYISSSDVAGLRKDDEISVRFETADPVVGTIDYIGVITDAESGTVELKIRIDNEDGKLRSGERCFIRIEASQELFAKP